MDSLKKNIPSYRRAGFSAASIAEAEVASDLLELGNTRIMEFHNPRIGGKLTMLMRCLDHV